MATQPERGAASWWRRAEAHLLAPVDIAWLAAFRAVYGLIVAVSMERFLAYGWVEQLLVGPRFHFKYWGFAWVQPLGLVPMTALFYVLMGLALAFAAGLCFRVVAPLLALGVSYVQLIDVSTYLNHYYLIALLLWLMAVSPAARVASVDAYLRHRRTGVTPTPTVARAWHWLFRLQIACVYVFAAQAKLQSDWLLHAQPLRIWLGQSTSLPLLGPLFTFDGAPLVFSWCGFLFDATIVGWLLWRRSRVLAYSALLGFHVFTRLLFDIGMFPFIMSLAALVFFEPSWPRRLLGRRAGLLGDAQAALTPAATAESTPRHLGRTRLALGLAGLYCAVQLALPLRYLAYGGNVLWHEQGMRLSWRVMVRAKGGTTTFLVRDPTTGQQGELNPAHFLTPLQQAEMSGQPDLILQFAQAMARDLEAQRGHAVEVHADSRASLNGRRAAPFIDPAIDLGQVQDGLGRFSWVLPAPTQPPPHTRPVL